MRVRYTPQARADLQSIFQYLDQGNRRSVYNVKRAIKKTIDLISEFPESGRMTGEQGTPMLPAGRYPYLIYWATEAEQPTEL